MVVGTRLRRHHSEWNSRRDKLHKDLRIMEYSLVLASVMMKELNTPEVEIILVRSSRAIAISDATAQWKKSSSLPKTAPTTIREAMSKPLSLTATKKIPPSPSQQLEICRITSMLSWRHTTEPLATVPTSSLAVCVNMRVAISTIKLETIMRTKTSWRGQLKGSMSGPTTSSLRIWSISWRRSTKNLRIEIKWTRKLFALVADIRKPSLSPPARMLSRNWLLKDASSKQTTMQLKPKLRISIKEWGAIRSKCKTRRIKKLRQKLMSVLL